MVGAHQNVNGSRGLDHSSFRDVNSSRGQHLLQSTQIWHLNVTRYERRYKMWTMGCFG